MLLPRNPDVASLCTLPVSHPDFQWRSHAESFLCDVNFIARFFSYRLFASRRTRAMPWLKTQTSTEASPPAITKSSPRCMLLSWVAKTFLLAACPSSPPHLAGVLAVWDAAPFHLWGGNIFFSWCLCHHVFYSLRNCLGLWFTETDASGKQRYENPGLASNP